MYQSIQGNKGLGKAIEFFTSYGITVALPLNDTQKYDLIIDEEDTLKKVSVKTSIFKPDTSKNVYEVCLKNSGGSSGKSVIRRFDASSCDYVFIYTGDGKTYLIPSDKIEATCSIKVGNKYTEFLVRSRSLS